MGTWTNTTPARLELAAWEQADRTRNVAATSSDAPATFVPLTNVPPVYTHIGHDAQYGRGRRNGRTIRLAILHTTESDTFTGTVSYNARRPETVSATAYVGEDGIAAGVAEVDRPWTTGRWNDESVAMEIIGRAAWSAAQWRARPRTLENITRLLVDWCRRHQLPPVWLTPAEVAEGASRHGTTPVAGIRRGITDHLDANLAARQLGASTASTSHHDIGPGLREVIHADVLPEVRRRLTGTTPPPQPRPPTWRPPMTALHMLDDTADPRILDTRLGVGIARGRLLDDNTFLIPIPDDHDPQAAVITVTAVNPTAPGHLTLFGDDLPASPPSHLNIAAGAVANTTLVNVGRHNGRPVVRGIWRRVGEVDLVVDLIAVIA